MNREVRIESALIYSELVARQARRGDFTSFIKLMRPEYRVEWFHAVIIKKLEDFLQKKIPRLMVFMPPRYGKSELTSRMMPSFIHGLFPNDQILAGSYNDTLASEFTRDVQRLVDSDTYRFIFPQTKIIADGSAGKYARTYSKHELIPIGDFVPKGTYRSAGVGGTFTGRGGNWVLLDDLIKNREDAESEAFRNKVWDFYTSSIRTRLEKNGSILLTITRWHDDDLAGRLLKLAKEDLNADQWEVVKFPAIREDNACDYDPRQPGEALWPWKFSLQELEAAKAANARDWAALYQQRPTVEQGNLIKRDWWQYYEQIPSSEILNIIQFWDCAQKVGLSNDFSVCATWARTRNGFLILDVWRGKLEAPDLERKVQSQFAAFKPSAVVIEDKSSGSSLIQNLRRFTTIPILAYDPGRFDKGVRLSAAAPTIEAKKVFLPKRASWVETFIAEHENFPGEHDDQCDTTSMAIDFFNKTTGLAPSIRTL